MSDSVKEKNTTVGALEKRCETMADGKRYLIYYTFEKMTGNASENPKPEIKNPQHARGGENV